MPKSDSADSQDLREAFHRALVAYLNWNGDNNRRAIYSYAAHHGHEIMPAFLPEIEKGRKCACQGEPEVLWRGERHPLSAVCRAAVGLKGPLPPLVRELIEDVITGSWRWRPTPRLPA